MAPTLLQAAALVLRASSTICPTTPTCPQDDSCTYVSDGVSLQVSCGTDFYGGDLQLAQTPTLAACMKACATTNGCAAISYVGQNCYMKSTVNAAQANNNVIGAAVTSRETTTPVTVGIQLACPVSYTCPENDGCTIQGANSRTFALSCGTDFYGGDFANMYAESLDDCTQTCTNNAQCVAASFVGGNGAGYCYLKDENNGAGVNYNVNAIALDTRVVVAPSATSSVSLSTMDSSSIATSTPSDLAPASSSMPSVGSSSASAPGTDSSTQTSPSATASDVSTFSTPSPTSTPPPTSTSTLAPTPTQILLNTGFEEGNGNAALAWTYDGSFPRTPANIGRVDSDARSGDYSFQAMPMNLNSWNARALQTVTVVPGKAYDVSVWSKASIQATISCTIVIAYNNRVVGNAFKKPTIEYTQNVQRVTADMTASGSGQLMIMATCPSNGGLAKIWFDDVTMTQV